jgi:4-hydroxybutyrate CoA-transferase
MKSAPGAGLDQVKRIVPADLAHLIQSDATVFLEQGACEPLALKAALTDQLERDIRLVAAPVTGLNDCSFGYRNADRLHPTVFVSTPQLADAIRQGSVSYVPLHWSDVARSFRERFTPDVALLQVSPPDEDGFCNLGANAAFELEVALMAKTIVVEVNRNVPRVYGDTALHQSRIHYWLETSDPLRAMPASGWGEVEGAIARHVDALIPDACTLQIGPGRVPDAVIERLMQSGKQVEIHSGILTDSILRLVQAQQGAWREREVVAGMLLGTPALYQAVDNHPRLRLRKTDFTHSQVVLGEFNAFMSVNSAVEVDLLGQVNAENADGRQISGVGGQVDFFRGARASANGASIIALPAATRMGSRIVAAVRAGVPVSTSRVDVDYIVTEYGSAAMRNRTEGERAEALIAIAHPSHRNELRRSLSRLDH